MVIDARGRPAHVYAGFPADHAAVDRRRFQAVTAACMLVRRQLFEADRGASTPAYRNGYEDVDFCLRAGELGHEVHYCPSSVVYHLESASRGYEELGDRCNRELYKSRWRRARHQDDVVTYAQDGLLEVEYTWLSVNAKVSPLLGLATMAATATRSSRRCRGARGSATS